MEPLVIHIKCSDSEAYRDLEELCLEHRQDMFIDFEQSWSSWIHEQSADNTPLHADKQGRLSK